MTKRKPKPEIPDTTTGPIDGEPDYSVADSFMEIFGFSRVDAEILAGDGDK